MMAAQTLFTVLDERSDDSDWLTARDVRLFLPEKTVASVRAFSYAFEDAKGGESFC